MQPPVLMPGKICRVSFSIPWDVGRDAGKLPSGAGLGCSVSGDGDHSSRHLLLGTEQRAAAVTCEQARVWCVPVTQVGMLWP